MHTRLVNPRIWSARRSLFASLLITRERGCLPALTVGSTVWCCVCMNKSPRTSHALQRLAWCVDPAKEQNAFGSYTSSAPSCISRTAAVRFVGCCMGITRVHGRVVTWESICVLRTGNWAHQWLTPRTRRRLTRRLCEPSRKRATRVSSHQVHQRSCGPTLRQPRCC